MLLNLAGIKYNNKTNSLLLVNVLALASNRLSEVTELHVTVT